MTKLQQLREARGWSRAELSRRAGLNQVTEGQIEAGRFIPYPSQTTKLACALGVSDDAATLLDEVPAVERRRDRQSRASAVAITASA